MLAELVNNHKVASKVGGSDRDRVIEELAQYKDVSIPDQKRTASQKDDIKEALGRSPDDSDTWIMRMYFVVKEKIIPEQSEEIARVISQQQNQFARNRNNAGANSTK